MRCNILGVLLLTVGMIANGEAAVNKSGTQVRTTQKARTSQKTATTRAAKKKTTGTAKGTASARTGQSKAAQNVRPGTELLKVKTKVQEQDKPIVEKNIMVDFATTMGPIRIKLYDDTPGHRDNFEKLVKEGYYDGMLFHRVIDEFMVQTGDPNSKNAGAGEALGAGDPNYTLPAEIKYPEHYHKYGALAAARTGDQFNPQRRSSGSQFYIVTGQKYSREQLEKMNRVMLMRKRQTMYRALENMNAESIRKLKEIDNDEARALMDTIYAHMERDVLKWHPETPLPENLVNDYTTVGGTPHLDGQYTVFGEVVSGMETVEKIQKAETDPRDRPKDDIRIISAKIVEK